MRAVRALLAADIILVDELVSPDIVDFARREAKKMLVGGTGKGSACEQDEINKVMVVLAKAGRRARSIQLSHPLEVAGDIYRRLAMASL